MMLAFPRGSIAEKMMFRASALPNLRRAPSTASYRFERTQTGVC